MKKVLTISYWLAGVLTVSAIMLSFHYSPAESLFLGTLFLPGALAAKFVFSKITSGKKADRIKAFVFTAIGILIGEILLIFLAHYILSIQRIGLESYYEWPDVPSVLQNPVFLSLIIAVLSLGSVYIDRILEKRFPSGPATITFMSDRRPVTIPVGEIVYVESNDTITVIHSADGTQYRNKTSISQWESILDKGFVRIHRAFIVNRAAITGIEKDIVSVGDTELPVSRKYKSALDGLVPSGNDKDGK